MGFEEVNADAFGAEVGFEADEDEGGRGAEVEDFGVPLEKQRCQYVVVFCVGVGAEECGGDLPCP